MKRSIFYSLALLGSLGAAGAANAACTQTLSPGASVASAIGAAPAGSTICLNAGNYGSVTLSNVVKSSDVTVQSASGTGATMSLNIQQSNHLKFLNLTLSGLQIDTNQQGGTKNVTVKDSVFTGQAVLNMGNNGYSNILLDGNTFDGINACGNCYEGRLQVIANPWSGQPSGVTISNNHFGKAGESDGIQNGANGVVIGPGNVFDGIVQGSYSRHVDAIQLYGAANTTVVGNYFANGDTYIMAPDGGESERFQNNVFRGYGSYYWKIQLGSHDNDVFEHNTVLGSIGVSIDAKTGSASSTNAMVRNNIMVGSSFKTTNSAGANACSNCTFTNNLFGSSSNAMGSSNLIGTPSFSGGSSPSTWTGFKLTSSSLGYQGGNDGKDVGTTYYGTGTTSGTTTPSPSPATLSAPTNLTAR